MKLSRLITTLENMKKEKGNVEVRLMTRQDQPLECRLYGVTSSDSLIEDPTDPRNENGTIVYLIEGSEMGDGDEVAWDVCFR